MQKINLIIHTILILFLTNSAKFEENPLSQQSIAQVPAQNTEPVKIETLVNQVLDASMSKPSMQGHSKKIISDTTAILVAVSSYLFSKKVIPLDENSKILFSIIISYLVFRLSNTGLVKVFKNINWDPRDLAVAETLLEAIKSGTQLTSDYQPIEDLFNQIITQEVQTKGSTLSISRGKKIELSQRIRSIIQAFKKLKSDKQ